MAERRLRSRHQPQIAGVRVELYNEAGKLARAYNVYRCWPSEPTQT